MGVMIKFKEGLQPSLLREILLHNVPAPKNLIDWKQKARERQTVYKELKNAGLHRGGPTDLQKKWAQKLGLKHTRHLIKEGVKAIDHLTSPRALKSSQWT